MTIAVAPFLMLEGKAGEAMSPRKGEGNKC